MRIVPVNYLKILHIYKSYYPDSVGGVEKLIQTLSSYTALHGVENKLITTTKRDTYDVKHIDNLEVHYYPQTFAYASCPVSLQLARQYKKHYNHADIIHYHFPWPFADFLHLMFAHNKPTLVTYHSDIVKQKILKIFYQPLMNYFLSAVTCIAPTSDNYLNSSPVLDKYRQKCTVIPIGLNEYNLSPAHLTTWQKRLSNPFLLFVGTLRYYKGLDYLLEAMQKINANLVIAGSGPYEQKLKDKAQQLHLDNVIFTGYVDDADKAALYHLCKIVVMPSHLRSEAFCLSLVEGLMFGKPLISTEIGTGSSFVNQNNITGLIVEPQNPSALRAAIQKLLTNDDLCAQLGRAARQRYEQLFTADKMAENYLEIYRKLSQKR